MDAKERQQKTFYYDRWRALCAGIIETMPSSFILIIAIRYFDADDAIQGLLATTWAFGLLLSPFSVAMIRRFHLKPTQGSAILASIMGFSFLVASLFPNLWIYTTCCLIGINSATLAVPLMTETYEQNYQRKMRGRLFSWSIMIKVGTTGIFAWGVGKWLTDDISRTPMFLFVLSAASFFSAYCLSRCPSEKIRQSSSTNPFQAIRFLGEDRPFLILIVSWMFLGFGNLMMMPLRVIMLAEDRYGFVYPIETISLLISIVPPLTQLSLSFFWGRLFDKLNIFQLRIFINLFFIASHACFFFINNFMGFLLGGILLGAAFSGGNIAWSLWVTKVAPKHQVADYMSVHTFMTGIRAIAAPLLAVYLATMISMQNIAWMSLILMFLAMVILIPEAWTLSQGKKSDNE
ncbi:MAG: MFS transporter [Verrucomicrobiota bacterium]